MAEANAATSKKIKGAAWRRSRTRRMCASSRSQIRVAPHQRQGRGEHALLDEDGPRVRRAGRGRDRMRTAESCNAEEFIKFLKEMNEIHHKMLIVPDNASCHKSKAIGEFVEGTDGAVKPPFLLGYVPNSIPQSPVERPQAAAARRVLCVHRGAGGGRGVAGWRGPDEPGQDQPVRDTRLNLPARVREAMIRPRRYRTS